ncbi:MAG: hypothetical protein HZB26_09415 [Candidatus Hydrogenedentes bacterium]|nr:hypothetical protein [Candidatus Hydrogenedentota bacterium]
MDTRSLLIRFPAFPFSFCDLTPDSELARLAASLIDAGHSAEIADFGTVAVLDRLFPHEHQASLQSLLDRADKSSAWNPLAGLISAWRTHGAAECYRSKRDSLCTDIAREIAGRRDVRVVAFKVDSVGNIDTVHRIAREIRSTNSRTILVGVGKNVELAQNQFLGSSGPLDALLLSDASEALIELVSHGDGPVDWSVAPNALYRCNGEIRRSARTASVQFLDIFPTPNYSREVYPTASNGEKARVFTIEERSGPARAKPAAGPSGKAVSAPARELVQLHALYGATAFHIDAGSSSHDQLRALVREVLFRRLRLSFSMNAAVENVDAIVLAALKSSGCRALGLDTPSGSQRLLMDYYQRPFGVTQLEQALRASKAAGLYTVAHLTYPSPHDDYHTEAETLRVLDRTRPHAAPIHPVGPKLSAASRYEPPGARPRNLRPEVVYAMGTAWDWLRETEPVSVSPCAARRTLAEAIEKRRISARVTEYTALLASLAGYSGLEDEFWRIVQRQFFSGDCAGIATWIGALNEAACDPARACAAEPWGQIQSAVGN